MRVDPVLGFNAGLQKPKIVRLDLYGEWVVVGRVRGRPPEGAPGVFEAQVLKHNKTCPLDKSRVEVCSGGGAPSGGWVKQRLVWFRAGLV